MTAFVVAALSLASLSVPYVPQTDALCGGAAAAMVFRYWGDAHAGVDQFGTLVERRAGAVGIATDALTSAVAARGWRTDHVEPTLAALRSRLASAEPVIVLLADRRNSYHYVVVVGATNDAVVVHDPSWGPSRPIRNETFATLWSAAQHWSLVVLPTESRRATDAAAQGTAGTAVGASTEPSIDPCEQMVNAAVEQIRTVGLERADDILNAVRAECPSSAGPYRELAGVRFAQKRWADAVGLAQAALHRDPKDAYALEVLGSSLFMQDDAVGALRAWNQIGRPQLDLVRIEGVHHTRYQAIAEALRLKPNTLLTADDFLTATRRLNELPDRATARLSLRPERDGFASVDVVIAEGAGAPRGLADWTGVAVHAAVDREALLTVPGFSGEGDVWTASWRWFQNRPRVAAGIAVPRPAGLFGVWRVEGSWEAETYAAGAQTRREERRHGGLTVSDWLTGNVRYSLGAGADSWDSGRRAASLGASLERRWLADRLSIAGNAATWLPIDGGESFHAGGVRAVVRSSTRDRVWSYQGVAGLDRVSDAAPLSLWPGAGEGRARMPLLRAHPLLDDGIIDVSAGASFGRTMRYASGEVQRWVANPKLVRIGVAGFIDVARAARGTLNVDRITQVDAGTGLRVRLPGVAHALRVDVAHGLRDGRNALSIGFEY